MPPLDDRAALAAAERIAHLGSWRWSIDSGELDWSAEIYRIFGLEPDAFAASYLAFLDRVHPDDRQLVEAGVAAALAGSAPYRVEHRVVRPDGSERWVEEQAEITRSPTGEPLEMLGTVLDITDRKAAAESLRQQRDLLDALLDTANALFVVLDRSGVVIRFNRACQALTGFAEHDIVGRPLWAVVIPDEERDAVRAVFAALVAERVPSEHVNPWLTRSGERRLVSWTNNVVTCADGAVAYVTAVGIDITAQHQAALELAVRGAAVDGAMNAVATADLEGRLTYVNRAFVELWQLDGAAEAIGRSALDFWDDPEAAGQVVASLLAGGHWSGDLVARRRDGSLLDVRLSSNLVRGPDGEPLCLVGFFLDVSQARAREKQLELSRRVFETVDEAIVVTDLAPRIVDVNDAFTRITGYTLAEVRGLNPSAMKSGRHDLAFYRAMWDELTRRGQWRGEVWDRRKSGELYQKMLTIRTVSDPAGEARHYVGVFSDITTARETEARLEHLTHYDPVTGMPNRALLLKLLGRAVMRAELHGHEVAVVLLDLDHFKVLNDSLGHTAGDQLLGQVAGRLENCLRGDDVVARLAGDEFGLLLNEVGADQLSEVAERLRSALAAPFSVGDIPVFVTASLGVAVAPGDGLDPEDLLAKADAAMYQAKENGRGQVRYFDSAINEQHRQRMELEHDLRTAVAEGHIALHYQPRVQLPDRTVVGVEGLARWTHPTRGAVPPAVFIPAAEETGLIVELGRHLLRAACRQLQQWRAAGHHQLFVSVNLSARQLLDPHLVADVASCLAEHDLPGERLELELTESLLMDPSEATLATLNELRGLGVCLSIDDFGTGYSSLSYLKRLPIQTVKIDRSFVGDLPACRESAALVRAIVSLGRNLDLRVVAEGVESDDQLAFLAGVGCDEAQGFLVARPLPADQVSDLL